MFQIRISEEGYGECGEPCTKTTDLYGNKTQAYIYVKRKKVKMKII
jgi:hypothetical protein